MVQFQDDNQNKTSGTGAKNPFNEVPLFSILLHKFAAVSAPSCLDVLKTVFR
jgi:hypothetical protein